MWGWLSRRTGLAARAAAGESGALTTRGVGTPECEWLLAHTTLIIIDKLFIVRLNVSHCLLDSGVPREPSYLV